MKIGRWALVVLTAIYSVTVAHQIGGSKGIHAALNVWLLVWVWCKSTQGLAEEERKPRG